MADVQITPSPNGPYLVRGASKIELVDRQGNQWPIEGDTVALCRCGHSEDKPFCDGAHRAVGFEDQCEAPVA